MGPVLPSAQNGKTWFRPGRRLFSVGCQASQSSGSPQAVNPALHPVSGPRLSVPRRQLSTTFLPEDEARRHSYALLQAEDERWLSHLQATHCALLLPCQTLYRNQVSRSILSQHSTKTAPAANAATTPNSSARSTTYGCHVQYGKQTSRSWNAHERLWWYGRSCVTYGKSRSGGRHGNGSPSTWRWNEAHNSHTASQGSPGK